MTIIIIRHIICVVLVFTVFFSHYKIQNKNKLIIGLIVTSVLLNASLLIGYLQLRNMNSFFWAPYILEEFFLHFFVLLGIFIQWIIWPQQHKKWMFEFYLQLEVNKIRSIPNQDGRGTTGMELDENQLIK